MGIITACALFVNGGYYSIVKNNTPLTICGGLALLAFFVVLWRKLSRIPDVRAKTERKLAVSILVFNALLVIVSVYLLGRSISLALAATNGALVFLAFLMNYLTLRMIATKNKSLFVLFLGSLLAPFALYVSVIYNDAIAQFLISLLLFLTTKNIKKWASTSFVKMLLYAAFIGFVGFLAIQTKAIVVILLVALTIAATIYIIGRKTDLKKAAIFSILALGFFTIPAIGLKMSIANHADIGLVHSISNWLSVDLASINTIKSNMLSFGISGMFEHLKIVNIVWMASLLALLIGGVVDIKEKQCLYKTFAKLTVIGLLVFSRFWEAQGEKIYIFFPLIFTLSVFMLFKITESDMIRDIVLTIRGFVKYKKNDNQYKKIKILNTADTMAQIKKGKSVIRLGDGEMAVMLGHSIWFQKQSDQLRQDLEKVIEKAGNKNLLVCAPRTIISLEGYRSKARRFWYRELFGTRYEWKKRLSEKVSYGETSVTRARTDLNARIQDEVFADWKKLFSDRDIVLIEGMTTRTGVKNDLFEEAKSVRRIIGPPKNAYDKVPRIIECFKAQKVKKTALILVSLGPAAKKIAMELNDEGYQVIDMGHLGQEYAFYYNGEYRRAENDDRFDMITDEGYEKSIIARIEK